MICLNNYMYNWKGIILISVGSVEVSIETEKRVSSPSSLILSVTAPGPIPQSQKHVLILAWVNSWRC